MIGLEGLEGLFHSRKFCDCVIDSGDRQNIQGGYLLCTSQQGQSAHAGQWNHVVKWVAAEGDATKRYSRVHYGN